MPTSTRSATDIADAVREGRQTAVDTVTAAFRAIRRTEPEVNAFSSLADAEALAAAERIDALPASERGALPLAGVPLAVKDSIPAHSPVVTRLTDAGAVVVGRTTTPELCVWGLTDSAENGITRNPWDPSRSPGGSSGGSAAAVAAGAVPLALGSDGMGSLRIPAACCGLVTLKPGRGVVPHADGENTWGGMSEQGPLVTTVADAALVFALLAGDDPDAVRDAVERGTSGGMTDGTGTRFGYSIASPISLGPVDLVSVSPAWSHAATLARRTLTGAGLTGVRVSIPTPANPFLLLGRWTNAVAGSAEQANRPVSSLERRNTYHALLGRTVFRNSGEDAGDTGANRAVAALRDEVERLLDAEDLDVLVTPSLANFPPPATDWHLRSWTRTLWANLRFSPFASQWNLLGWPGMTVPVGTAPGPGGAAMPVSVQLIGRPGSELRLLETAATLESANPWQRVAPGRGA